MKESINGINDGIEPYVYQIQLLRAIRDEQE